MLGASGLPPWRAAGGRDLGWRGRLTEVDEDVAHGRAVGDEGDDAHRAATVGAHQRENFVDAGEQQRPGIAGGATVGRFGAGWLGRLTDADIVALRLRARHISNPWYAKRDAEGGMEHWRRLHGSQVRID